MNSHIFKDQQKNKLIDLDSEKNIITLGKYYPKHDREYLEMDEFSNKILNIKKDKSMFDEESKEHYYYNMAIDFFTNKLVSILSDSKEFVVCVMPTHFIGNQPSGIRTIADRICLPKRINGTKVISRIMKMEKKAIGGSRDLRQEIKSLTIKFEKVIENQQVLLLDDVTTTGTSLGAGKYVLEQAGAELVALLALGETQSE